MSVAILYHNPKRPEEVGVAVVPDPKHVTEEVASLMRRGFVIDKISDHAIDTLLHVKT
jgi:hypothetical protein